MHVFVYDFLEFIDCEKRKIVGSSFSSRHKAHTKKGWRRAKKKSKRNKYGNIRKSNRNDASVSKTQNTPNPSEFFFIYFFFSIPFCMCCSLSFSLAACFCVVSYEKKLKIYIYITSLRKREKRSSNRNSSIYVLSITHSETISTENINHNGNYRFVKIRFVHFVCVVFGVCFDN